MKAILKIFLINISFFIVVLTYDPATETPKPQEISFKTVKPADISPEIINELKDFEHLIPAATIDEIAAEHYLVDGNFRTAAKYLRSNEFPQLQRQLLAIPEIINVLEFLHLMTISNDTETMHMGATSSKTEKSSLDNYNDNRIDKTTTNIATDDATTTSNATVTRTEGTTIKKPYKRPQFHMAEKNDDYNAADVSNVVARTSIEEQLPVSILLLENSEIKTQAYDVVIVNAHNNELISPSFTHRHNHHNHRSHQRSLGSFTSFVQEVLEHLPKAAYQNMIKDKCTKNAKFAEFYKALRSSELKPIVDEVMKTPSVMKIIETLNSHDIDVKSLEPIAFEVISWGPIV